MARPRSISDERLLSAAAAVLAEVGPSAFTLAKAAERARVAPATYVKRFGTKQAVFLGLSRRWVASVATDLDAAAETTTGVDRIRAATGWGMAEMDVPEHAANMLAALAIDLQDPQLTALLDQGWSTWRDRVGALIEEAVAAGQLPGAPEPAVAAEMLFALVEGTRIAWCVRPQGSLKRRVDAVVDELLRSWGATDQPAPAT